MLCFPDIFMNQKNFFFSDYDGVGSDTELLGDEAQNLDIEEYFPIIECDEPKKLFIFVPVEPKYYGLYQVVVDLLGLLFFTASVLQSQPSYISIVLFYFLWCYILAPLYQNFRLVFPDKTSTTLTHGCLACVASSVLIQVLSGDVSIAPITLDEPRYIPLSVYNHVFMIMNPGRELNHELPKHIQSFGVCRTLLLIYSASAKAGYNMIVFVHALQIYKSDAEPLSSLFALVALVIALSELRLYLITSIFGTLFYPYIVMLNFAFFLPTCPCLLNPGAGNPIMIVLLAYWNAIVKYGS
jgi:hypothetical protein